MNTPPRRRIKDRSQTNLTPPQLDSIADIDLQKLENYYSKLSEKEREEVMKWAMKEVARARGLM